MNQEIDHIGTIEQIDGETVKVRITQTSACASCAAAHLCKSTESKERLIEVQVNSNQTFHQGDMVKLKGTTHQGLKVVFISYFLPLLLILLFLFIADLLHLKETLMVLLSLVLIAIYYFILYFLKARLKKIIKFNITHISNTNI